MPELEYPKLLSSSSPLLLRTDRYSLVVDAVTFFAKVKIGELFKGFSVFVTGIGNPIYEYNDTSISLDTSDITLLREELCKKAEDWITAVSDAIESGQSENPVKDAIDALKTQLHSDITSATEEITKVAYSIKGENDPYTISQALRESSSYGSVAKEIHDGLGSGGVINTSLGAINQSLGTVNGSINSVGGTVSTISGNVATIKSDTSSIKINVSETPGNGTLKDIVNNLNNNIGGVIYTDPGTSADYIGVHDFTQP